MKLSMILVPFIVLFIIAVVFFLVSTIIDVIGFLWWLYKDVKNK